MSNVEKTKEGLFEKSTVRKIESPMDMTHSKAIEKVEKLLKSHKIAITHIHGVDVHILNDETVIGENTFSPGKYVMVEFRVVIEA